MEPTTKDADALLDGVTPVRRREDARILLALLKDVTGRDPVVWSGNVVGFGACHYRYPTGNQGDSPIVGFAPRRAATTIYLLDGVDTHAEALDRLGPHSTGVGCLYLKDLSDVDLDVLREIVARSWQGVTSGGPPGMSVTVTD